MSKHRHKWKWMGGGIGQDDRMYCKKECIKCHTKREISEINNNQIVKELRGWFNYQNLKEHLGPTSIRDFHKLLAKLEVA